MIRKLIPLFLVAGLTACAAPGTQRASSDAPAAGDAPAAACDAQPVQDLIGKKYSDSVADDARSRSQSAQVRVMRPGQVMTMEYNPSRLNIILDGGDAITALRCG